MSPLAAGSADGLLALLLLDLAVIAGCALAFGVLARRLGQAVVVGEIVAGLVLGPSLLGLLPGSLDHVLFPPEIRPYLETLANVALVLFIFGAGYEIDLARVRRCGRDILRITAASVLVPAIAAIALAPALWAAHPPLGDDVSPVQFTAFLAIALAVTALPVLARILADTRLSSTPLGSLALVVAGMTDLLAWVALAALTTSLGVTERALPIGAVALSLLGFLAFLVLGARPLLRRALAAAWCQRHGPAGASLLLLVALMLCASATTWLGLHPVFGAFALGVVCPRPRDTAACSHPGATRRPVADSAQHAAGAAQTLSAAGLLLVPFYFIVTGLKMDVTNLGLGDLLELGGILVVASAAKVAGVMWAAARAGLDQGRSLGLGLLLNTRGLTELIVLGIGYDAGVIDNRLFTVLVLVAVITTAATTPLLRHALRIGRHRTERVRVRTHAAGLSG